MLNATPTIAKTDDRPRHRVAHAENPTRPGVALCGAKLTRTPGGSGADRCVVCLDMARGLFIGR